MNSSAETANNVVSNLALKRRGCQPYQEVLCSPLNSSAESIPLLEDLAPYQIGPVPVSELIGHDKRYGIGRTQFYERRDRLGLKFQTQSNRAYATLEQVDQLDALHRHIKAGGHIDGFVESLSAHSTEQSELAITREQFSEQDGLSALAVIADLVLTKRDPLAHIRALDEACNKSWLLPTKELRLLLGLKSLRGRYIERYGFVCHVVGKMGAQNAWKVERIPELLPEFAEVQNLP